MKRISPRNLLLHARALKELDGIPWPMAVDEVDGTLHLPRWKPNSARRPMRTRSSPDLGCGA
jgi:hypothetical protein